MSGIIIILIFNFLWFAKGKYWISHLIVYWILFKISIVKWSHFGGKRVKMCAKWSYYALKIRLKVKSLQNVQCIKWHKTTPKNQKIWNFQILSDRPDRPIPAIWIGRIVSKSIFDPFPRHWTRGFQDFDHVATYLLTDDRFSTFFKIRKFTFG